MSGRAVASATRGQINVGFSTTSAPTVSPVRAVAGEANMVALRGLCVPKVDILDAKHYDALRCSLMRDADADNYDVCRVVCRLGKGG